MSNFLRETHDGIKRSGHTTDDIIFIGSPISGHRCTWEQFEKLADFEYDPGFGTVEIATDLIIVFRDGSSMWRSEHNGSEWWDYAEPFIEPKESHTITRLSVVGTDEIGWCSLNELNKDGVGGGKEE